MAISALPAANSFDGGTAGGTITTANSGGSSGEALTQVSVNNGTATYSSEAYGLSAKCDCAPPSGSGSEAYLAWELGSLSTPHVGGRFDIFLSAYPAGSNLLGIWWLSAVGTNGVSMYVQSDGKIRMRGTTGATVFTTAETLPLSAWVRIEFDINLAAAGHYDIRFYLARYSAIANATYAADIAWPGAVPANIGLAIFGLFQSGTAIHAYYDNIQINGTGLPGPVTDPAPPPPSATVGPLPLSNTAQGGTPGADATPATTGGASGDHFTSVALSGGGSVKFIADVVGGEETNVCYEVTTGSASGTTAQTWALTDTSDRIAGRVEIFLPSPGIQDVSGTGYGAVCEWVRIQRADVGGVTIMTPNHTSISGTVVDTPTGLSITELSGGEILFAQNVLPIGHWFRIEFDFLLTNPGTYNVRIYDDLTTTTPSAIMSDNRTWVHPGPAERVVFAAFNGYVGGWVLVDNLQVNDDGLPGPYVAPEVGNNDDFADAYTVTVAESYGGTFGRVPYVSAAEDISAFGTETGEQLLIGYAHTAWWKYTPTVTGSATITVDSGVPDVGIQLFTGSVLSSLTLRASREHEPLTYVVTGGVTYYIQVSNTGVPSDLTLTVDGPATVAGDTTWTPPTLPELPPITSYPPGGGLPDPATTIDPITGAGSSTVLALVREFSSQVRQPIRILGPSTISMVDPAATNDMLGVDPEEMYSSATVQRKASARALSVLTGDVGVAAAATLVTNDASILVSGWSIPDRLPVPTGLPDSPVKAVRMTFTPDAFSADVEFHVA